jgi:aspartyl-tRNA(Asn)/glutamyl-tRNA(Gln) amidotransferase subunit B
VASNPKAVDDYRAGKPVLGFFVGQVMKATRGQANAALVQEAVRERLERGDGPLGGEASGDDGSGA